MFSDYRDLSNQALSIIDGKIDYFPTFLNDMSSIALKEQILSEVVFDQNEIKIFGKLITVPRKEAYFSLNGENYSYSGKQLKNQSFPKFLNELRLKVQAQTGYSYNALLINLYRNGKDSNGWHADDEKSLGVNPSIASLSLGAQRIFELKHTATKQKIKIELASGSLLHMHGALQHHWKHQLPKMKQLDELRINLTFRCIVTSN